MNLPKQTVSLVLFICTELADELILCYAIADRRKTYDQFGKQGLFGETGRPSSSHSSFHRHSSTFNDFHRFHFQDPKDIFAEAFGDSDPFADFFSK